MKINRNDLCKRPTQRRLQLKDAFFFMTDSTCTMETEKKKPHRDVFWITQEERTEDLP
jgi:hypothetical protein